MSLVNTLMSGSGLMSAYDESTDITVGGIAYDDCFESFFVDKYTESMVTDIIDMQEASLVADVIGEVQVIKEGADPQILMEGILGNIKDAIVKFFQRVCHMDHYDSGEYHILVSSAYICKQLFGIGLGCF